MAKTLKQKLDLIFWFIMALLPLIFYLCEMKYLGLSMSFKDFMVRTNDCFMPGNLTSKLNTILSKVGFAGNGMFVFNYYMQYLILIEVSHCFFDILVFVPRLAHSFIERGENFCKKR